MDPQEASSSTASSVVDAAHKFALNQAENELMSASSSAASDDRVASSTRTVSPSDADAAGRLKRTETWIRLNVGGVSSTTSLKRMLSELNVCVSLQGRRF